MPHTSHLHVRECSPTSIALLFLQSCLNAHCVLAYIACRRSIGGSFTNFTSLALQPLVFRQLSAELESGFIIWPTGVNCTLSLRAVPFSASLSTLIPLETGALTLQVAGAKKIHRWHSSDGTASAFRKRLAFLALPWSVLGESTDSWAREGKWKSFEGSAHCIERWFRSRGSLLLRLDEGQLTSASWAPLTVESYGRILKD